MPASRARLRWRFLRIFIAGMLCLHLLVFVNLRERIKRGYPDFTVFYTAATILRAGLGHQLYDNHVQYEIQKQVVGDIAERRGPLPYIHPPFEALIFLPLSWLPYPQAFAVWDALNLIALFGVAVLLRRSVNALRRIPPWEFVIVSLAFFPVFDCFLQGQDSILLLLLCVLGCVRGWLEFARPFSFLLPIIRIPSSAINHAKFVDVVWQRSHVECGVITLDFSTGD